MHSSKPTGLDALERALSGRKLQEVADHLGVKYQLIQQWRDPDRKYATPAEHVLRLEALTGVSRYELRPDVYGTAPHEAAA